MLEILATPGSTFSGSDWKYGWPHKFYLETINPEADKLVQVGSSSKMVDGVRVETPIMGHHTMINHKFYNEHLKLHSKEEVAEFSDLSLLFFGIEWFLDDRGLGYRAIPGTQQYGIVGPDCKPIFNRF